MKTFKFERNQAILIYGYGEAGINLYKKLVDCCYNPVGFIDKNALKLKNDAPCPLFSPEELTEERQENIIVLTFQNMLEQERVAAKLASNGFRKIVFLNRDDPISYDKHFRAYNDLVFGPSVAEFDFPYAKDITKNPALFYYRELDESLIIEVPSTLIFSASKQSGSFLAEKNITALMEYNAIFEAIIKGNTNTDWAYKRYIEITCGEDRGKDDFLRDRVELFDMLYKEYQTKGISFFRNSPSLAKWNDKGYFNLVDGHHRAIFLVNNYNHYIPIEVKRMDYETWCNSEVAETCSHYIRSNSIVKTYTPILNPYFMGIQSVTENRGNRTASCLYKFFGEEDVSEWDVLDINSNLSYYAQVFSRMGAKSVIAVEGRTVHRNLAELLTQLQQVRNVKVVAGSIADLEENERFKVVLMVNDMQLASGTNSDISKWLKKIDCLSKKYFIWRSFEEPESEKEYILQNSEFKKYCLLNMEFVNGKVFEVGVYEK